MAPLRSTYIIVFAVCLWGLPPPNPRHLEGVIVLSKSQVNRWKCQRCLPVVVRVSTTIFFVVFWYYECCPGIFAKISSKPPISGHWTGGFQTHSIMALIQSNILSRISGKLNGSVFARNTSGNYVRNSTKPINPRTNKQLEVRKRFTNVAAAWRSLNELQQTDWIAAATTYPYVNRIGEPITLSGQQLFNLLNNSLLQAGLEMIDDVPAFKEFPGVTLNSVGNDFLVNVADGVASTDPLTVIFYATDAASAGINRPAPQAFKFMLTAAYDDVIGADVDITVPWQQAFGGGQAGQKFFVKAEVVNSLTGQRVICNQVSRVI